MHAQLGLGSASWGLPYGVSSGRKASRVEVQDILAVAQALGVNLIDTAPLYGTAEAVIGSCDAVSFNIVSKVNKTLFSSSTKPTVDDMKRSLRDSLESLNRISIYGLLVHDVRNIFSESGDLLIDFLCQSKDEGLISKIGVSVYHESHIDDVLERFVPDLVQLPLNALDQRFLRNGYLDDLQRIGAEIHVRSVFLQGLLLLDLDSQPPYFSSFKRELKLWSDTVRQHGMTKLEAALSFVRNVSGVDRLIVGVTNAIELRDIHTIFSSANYFDASKVVTDKVDLLNPSLWRL